MASDLNRVMLIGRLVRDPELRYTQNGTAVANFSIANNRSYVQSGDKKEMTSFFSCIAWSKLGELIVQYCKKGHRIGLEGRLQQRSWDDRDGNRRSTIEVVVENVQFLESRRGGDDSQTYDAVPANDYNESPAMSDNPFSDEDIPF